MYTLKGIFPEAKKESKKNFIKENMKQLKYVQAKPKEPKFTLRNIPQPRLSNSGGTFSHQVKSSPSSKCGKISQAVSKTSSNAHKKQLIKKGDMAEFLRRKEQRKAADPDEPPEDYVSTDSTRLRDIGCQTIETNLAQRFTESTKLTMLYPKEEEEAKIKASGDSGRCRNSPLNSHRSSQPCDETIEFDRNKSRLNSILERKDKDHKDPYLPAGYQKGVVPKYLKERKEQSLKECDELKANDTDAVCPPGHVLLPDNERKETLRMLRNSFAELVNEINKMPVKTDTLKMRNRKMELEKQLAKLEEGIKVFSRPTVFVKIGE